MQVLLFACVYVKFNKMTEGTLARWKFTRL